MATMNLILWRHAEAEDGTPDQGRVLTRKGLKQAQRMAKWLQERLSEDAVFLASPAQRTLQTAHALGRDFRVMPELGTSGSPESLLSVIKWPATKGSVVIVGHQPTLGETAALLLTGRKAPWALKKGAVIWLARRDDVSDARVMLRAAIAPDLL